MKKNQKASKRRSALGSLLLALALLVGTLGALPSACFAAQPETAAFHSTYGFRLRSSAKMELQFRDKLEKNYTVNGNTYYGSQSDLSRQLRDQMVRRSDQVVLRLATDRRGLTGSSKSAVQAREELFLGLLNDATAQRNSVSARDGDYLRWPLGLAGICKLGLAQCHHHTAHIGQQGLIAAVRHPGHIIPGQVCIGIHTIVQPVLVQVAVHRLQVRLAL